MFLLLLLFRMLFFWVAADQSGIYTGYTVKSHLPIRIVEKNILQLV